jgi:hypothetical protein
MNLAEWGIWGTAIMLVIRVIESVIATQKNDKAKGIIAMIKEFFKIG